MREKRPATAATAVPKIERMITAEVRPAVENVVISRRRAIEPPERTNITEARPSMEDAAGPRRKAIEPPERMTDRRGMQKGAIPKVKRVRVNEANAEANDRFAQQLADWPNRQPTPDPSQPPMSFDAAVIENFLQHAARFCLRRNPTANEADVAELLQKTETVMYGRRQNPPTDVERAVRSAQKWQYTEEIGAMWKNASQLFYNYNAPNPGNYNIHVSFKGEASSHASTPYVRTIVPKSPQASIEEIVDVPKIMPTGPWMFRFSQRHEGDINAVIEAFRPLGHGVKIRRDGGMVEFVGPPVADVALSVEYHNQEFRLRLCSTYVIINERFRMDANGVSQYIQNDEALAVIPDWEIGFLAAEFENTRVRFAEQRARLWLQETELVLTAV